MRGVNSLRDLYERTGECVEILLFLILARKACELEQQLSPMQYVILHYLLQRTVPTCELLQIYDQSNPGFCDSSRSPIRSLVSGSEEAS